ncbi:unnamed protein product, partial [Mesorhabditis belari]|uniref:Uncharacterized protein n=1 Tax=Mesorhabditis belari TaxID=2138241 RepID=A0AAF3FGS7_9BILA
MSMLRKPLICIEVGTEDLDEMEKALTKAADRSKVPSSGVEENIDLKTPLIKETPVVIPPSPGLSMITNTSTPMMSTLDFATPSISAATIGLANTQITPIGIAAPPDTSQSSSSFRTPQVRLFPGSSTSSS